MTIIPCIHNNEGRNFPESYDRLNVRILYKDAIHLVYMHDVRCHNIADRSLLSNPLDPFCPLCKTDVLDNFSSNSFSNYSISHIDKFFDTLQERVHMKIRKIEQLNDKNGQGGNNTKLKAAGRVYSYVLPVQRHRDLYYSDPLELYSYFWNWGGAATQPRPTPASKLAIEELERVEVTADHGANEARFIEEDCVVCLEGLAKTKAGAVVLVRLPCEHVFHEECVVQWLRTSHFCPLCRFELPVETSE